MGRRSTVGRIPSLLTGHPDHGDDHRPWTCGDVGLWADWLPAKGILHARAKELFQSSDAKQPFTIDRLADIFEPGAFQSFRAAYERGGPSLLEWWSARVVTDVRHRIHYAAEIAARRMSCICFQT